eukprot:364325-Chlamydomonas_euryale.AAC.16
MGMSAKDAEFICSLAVGRPCTVQNPSYRERIQVRYACVRICRQHGIRPRLLRICKLFSSLKAVASSGDSNRWKVAYASWSHPQSETARPVAAGVPAD